MAAAVIGRKANATSQIQLALVCVGLTCQVETHGSALSGPLLLTSSNLNGDNNVETYFGRNNFGSDCKSNRCRLGPRGLCESYPESCPSLQGDHEYSGSRHSFGSSGVGKVYRHHSGGQKVCLHIRWQLRQRISNLSHPARLERSHVCGY